MLRNLAVAFLALAAASAVSGHVIRHRGLPKGWETGILQNYTLYHERYLQYGCEKKHNTTFFGNCCHPLLKGEPLSVIEAHGCPSLAQNSTQGNDCDDGNSSVPPISTPQPSSSSSPSPSPAYTTSAYAQAKAALEHFQSASTTPTYTEPSYTPTSTHATVASSSPSPTPASGGDGSDDGSWTYGGYATWYTQGGVAGACGITHGDGDLIAAMIKDSGIYNEGLCGKQVEIINLANSQSVTVVVADECPGCPNDESIDLSTGAFQKLGDLGTGVLSIKWKYV
ncbi:RlpA-like double-psi beta-barrel-protein domain-containing protein-containing protein [Russula compacta]|nr:RlpA-like double-psi beta-barrel-protein domain-containing protein-containing protein [Russula compacta]